MPDDWHHVGLLPQQQPDGSWRWPREPGEYGCGWLEAVELRTARRHGWDVTVVESLLWPRSEVAPMRQWGTQLVNVSKKAQAQRDLSPDVRSCLRQMVRAIMLHGIGAMHGRPRVVNRSCHVDEAGRKVPKDAEGLDVVGDRVLWQVRQQPKWPELVHPEWTAAVWAATRTRLVSARNDQHALALPAPAVVGFRGDAMYLTCAPAWTDDGSAGAWRVKSTRGALHVPDNWHGFDRMMGRGRG